MKRITAFLFILILFLACGDDSQHEKRTKDRQPNGGVLRFVLDGKSMYDRFFEAQFTAKGDLFKTDNLQLYNFGVGSDKYPKFMINLDTIESDINKWQGLTFPLNFLIFTPAPNKPLLGSSGELLIIKVTPNSIEGQFDGWLINKKTGKKLSIRGEFQAVLTLNN